MVSVRRKNTAYSTNGVSVEQTVRRMDDEVSSAGVTELPVQVLYV